MPQSGLKLSWTYLERLLRYDAIGMSDGQVGGGLRKRCESVACVLDGGGQVAQAYYCPTIRFERIRQINLLGTIPL